MEPRGERPNLTRVGGSSKLPVRVAVVAVAFIVVALLKPWAGAPSNPAVPSPGVGPSTAALEESPLPATTATPRPIPEPTLDPDAVECLEPIGWRIVTLQRSADRESRSWIVVQPASATGPADPAIGSLRVAGDDIVEIGFCGNGQRAGLDPAVIAMAWRQAADGTWLPQALTPVSFAGGQSGGFATMYVPTPRTDGAATASAGATSTGSSPVGDRALASTPWSRGRYVFSVSFGGDQPRTSWFGADVITGSATEPPVSPAPRSSSGPAGSPASPPPAVPPTTTR